MAAQLPVVTTRHTAMADEELNKEERILRVMKRVLTDVAKDTYTRPGHRHPLSEETVNGIRDCLTLITAREAELNTAAGRPMDARPRFIDEPQSSVVVPLNIPRPKDKG
jgi:hypothetical protein